MATQANGEPAQPDPVDVGNEFVKQYYNVLHKSPQLVHKFYKDASELSRPGPDGQMVSVTTMQGINEKILSMNYERYKVEILTADAQASYEGGVLVLVTGCLIEDDIRTTFTQSFFLAPQDVGYYVLNDMFRFVGGEAAESVPLENNEDEPQALEEALEAPSTLEADAEATDDVKQPAPEEIPLEEADLAELEVQPITEIAEDIPEVKESVTGPPADSGRKDVSASMSAASDAQEDAPKKSFASIVSALKQNSAPFQVRATPVRSMVQPRAPSAPEVSVSNDNISPEKIEIQTVKRHSVFVGNLPLDATPAQLEAAFKRFGSIKPNGIQVRSSKGSCYGFVEFEAESSMTDALQEASIPIGSRTAHIEPQKRDGSERKPIQGRGGFRNDHFRGRSNFGGGRNYGKNDYEKRSEFSSRPGGAANNGGSYQNGGGRGPRQTEKAR